MRKLLSAAICCLGIAVPAFSQNGWLPNVYLPANTPICDSEPYKLVFWDDFNGNKLAAPWITFHSWNQMWGGDTDNWTRGRINETNAIHVDSNIIVSDGTCKLLVRYAPNTSWKCDTCPGQPNVRNFTIGNIALPYAKPSDSTGTPTPHLSFNNGKFEARIKLPIAKHSWAAFWLWKGTYVDEIDIAESFGGVGGWPWLGPKKHPQTSMNMHSWAPDPNIYNVPSDAGWGKPYGNQDWWSWIFGDHWHQEDWNTYTCEWDSAVVKFYLNGNLESTLYKYYQLKAVKRWNNPFKYEWVMIGSECNPNAGYYSIMKGFPYLNNSESQLRLGVAIAKEITDITQMTPMVPSTVQPGEELARMEVDYVKAWQRRPEHSWATICNADTNLAINGPDIICNATTFTINTPGSNASWHRSAVNLRSLSSSTSAITVEPNSASSSYSNGYVDYNAINNACPNPFVSFARKVFDVGPPTASRVICTETHSNSDQTVHYNLSAQPTSVDPNIPSVYNSPHTFNWKIEYGTNFSQVYQGSGQYVSTPPMNYIPGTINRVRWTVTITNACGSVTKNGQMSYYLMRLAPDGSEDKDRRNRYFVANITDDAAYKDVVSGRLEQTFFNVKDDDITINSGIEKIELQELAPYLVLDSTDISGLEGNLRKQNPKAEEFLTTRLYPNPASSFVNVVLNDRYSPSLPVSLNLSDVMGKHIKTLNATNRNGQIVTVDISDLPSATYVLTIKQSGTAEHHRLMKSK